MPSGYRVMIDGMRTKTDLDVLKWSQRAQSLGVGEVVLNAVDTDGVQEGYELKITKMVSEMLTIPVIASGGAGKPEHLVDVLKYTDAALVASMVHFGSYSIKEIKAFLSGKGITVRDDYLL